MSPRRRSRFQPDASRFLENRCRLRVRFQEVDTLRVVWHGHYLSYFEEGRNAFGRQFGISYQDILEAGLIAPLVHIECDYFSPARFDQELEVRTRMLLVSGARVHFAYQISDAAAGNRLCSGSSVQVFTDTDGNLLLTRPTYFEDFVSRHRDQAQDLP